FGENLLLRLRIRLRRRFRGRVRRSHLDGIATLQCLGWTIDHLVLRRQAGSYLDGIAKIPSELDRLEGDFAVAAEDGDLGAAVCRHQRGCRQADRVRITGEPEVDTGICGAAELAVR